MPFKPDTEITSRFKPDTEDAGEPTFGQKAGALGYGAVTGLVGGLGELEKFGAYDVPEFFGAKVKRGEGIPFGRETIFPTIAETEKVLKKVGIENPREEVVGYKTAGEVIGGLGPALPGLAKGTARALVGTPSRTSEAYAKAAEDIGFKLSPAQVRQDIPVPAKGATFFAEKNQSLANKLASASTGKEAREISPDFIRSRLSDLGKEFDKVYKGKDFNIGPDAVSALRSIASNEMQLPVNAQVTAVKNTAKTLLDNYESLARTKGAIPSTFSIEGNILQRIRSDLMAGARSATNRQDAHQIYELIDIIDSSVAKAHPEVAAKLAEIRPLYRNTIVLEDLTKQGGIQQGNISLEKLGNMLGQRKSGLRNQKDIDQLGEMGRQLKLRARWETEGRGSTGGEDVLGKVLGTGADIASTLALTRTRGARATQRMLGKQPEVFRIYRPGLANVPAGVAAGTATRPFQSSEEE
jgi:hypothetical protein